jgi:hypothetical protein
MPRIFQSFIQSTFRRGDNHGNFEAVVVEGDQLWHWFRDNQDPALPWRRAGAQAILSP